MPVRSLHKRGDDMRGALLGEMSRLVGRGLVREVARGAV